VWTWNSGLSENGPSLATIARKTSQPSMSPNIEAANITRRHGLSR
jgi:hypothetical protein